ncbi:unnamed protein product [Phytophthora fragariaefolia]|uniref:Unnamed protein product n=1 Tax=Phytophthora fragariaefolia TaxID=1490495 RepID=A0A9W6XJP9_9STRA|nr:unnamed protein product [Phytophthora fragariaefolia]
MAAMVNCAAVRRVTLELRRALQRWHRKGKCGGLKQLAVPTREEEDRVRTSTSFIDDVITFCPNVEYLDGYTYAIDEMHDVACEEQWMISLDTWERFNRTCTNLRDFNWVLVPFADPFFRVFGQYVKPKLKKLALTSNLSWNWRDYFKMVGPPGPQPQRPGYGFLANDAAALLKGCPALTELDISIDQKRNLTDFLPLLDAGVFGDKFWKAVVEHCPLLQSVYLHDCSAYGGSRAVRPIETFTDAALIALADQPCLASIELSAVCCSGNGVFEFLRRAFKATGGDGGNRSLDISLAGPNEHETTLPHPFYLELLNLLTRLAETGEEELGAASCSHKAALNVFNPHSSFVDTEWSISYVRDKLKPLLEKVANAHPLLDMHIVLCRDNEESFLRIDNIELDWGLGFQDGDVFIEDEYVADVDSEEDVSDEEEEGEEVDVDPVHPHEYILRRRAMLLNDFEVVSDEDEGP